MLIRNEIETDAPAIREAMKLLPQATGTEADIIDGLRADDALSLSLVAEDGGEVIGYRAASNARVGAATDWGLIGPLASSSHQNEPSLPSCPAGLLPVSWTRS